MKFLSKKKLVEHLVSHKTSSQEQTTTNIHVNIAKEIQIVQHHHQQTEHIQTNFKTCKLCNQGFLDDNSLANHVTDFHTVISNTCDECNNEFPTANLLNKHQQTCLFEPRCFPCRKCESFWNSNAALRLHYSETHQENVDICGVCGFIAENSKALEEHWKTLHLSWTQVLNCDFCDREFYSQGSLDNHTYKCIKFKQASVVNCASIIALEEVNWKHIFRVSTILMNDSSVTYANFQLF